MARRRIQLRIDHQIVMVALGAAVAATVAALAVASWGFDRLGDMAVARQTESARVQIANQTLATLRLVTAQSDAVQEKVDADLKVARFVLDDAGSVSFRETDPVTWSAINQFTRETTEMDLPAMVVGADWLGQNRNLSRKTIVVDDIFELVGGTTTIFQRMNDEGDMLRVATNVETLDGTRAIGTYIPAINPDGNPNPVVNTVLAGETFRGIAFVVNAWYVTAYEPIFDAAGEVVGILYVGVKQENIPAMRAAIENTTILDSGVVAILGGTGNDAGMPIISDVFEEGVPLGQTDAGPPEWLAPLLDDAVAQPGELVAGPEVELDGLGNSLLYATYFEPWDWVVLSVTPITDITSVAQDVETAATRSSRTLLVAGALVLVLVGLTAGWLATTVARRVKAHASATDGSVSAMTSSADALASTVTTSLHEAETMSSTSTMVADSIDDIAVATQDLSQSFAEASVGAGRMGDISNRAVDAVGDATETINRLNTSMSEIGRATNLIGEIAGQTNLLALNATIEAMAAGEAGRGFAVVAHEVKELAASTSRATDEINRQISVIAAEAEAAMGAMGRIASVTGELADVQSSLAAAVAQQESRSEEISRSISQAASGAAEIAQRAKTVAGSSRDAVTAAGVTETQVRELRTMIDDLRSSVGATGHDSDHRRLVDARRT